jgi:hypothetical protein
MKIKALLFILKCELAVLKNPSSVFIDLDPVAKSRSHCFELVRACLVALPCCVEHEN